MIPGVQVDLKQLVTSNTTFGPAEVQQLVDGLSADFATNHRLLREAVQELESREGATPASRVRLGVCYYLLGRYRLAVDALSTADGGALAQFYLGKSHFARQDYKSAIDA